MQTNATCLKFYAIYMSKLTQYQTRPNAPKNLQIIADNISYLLDQQQLSSRDQSSSATTLGEHLCQKLIKKFDKHFLATTSSANTTVTTADTLLAYKAHVANLLKCVFSLSASAKKEALKSGLVETLIEHLKYTHSKLNLRSLNTVKSQQQPPQMSSVVTCLLCDLRECLLILNYLMCSVNTEYEEDASRLG